MPMCANPFIKLVITAIVVATNSFAAAKVDLMSLEKAKQTGATRYSEVSLKCDNDSESRLMRKPEAQFSLWCSADVAGLCNSSKFSLARKICNYDAAEFKSLAANKNRAREKQTLAKEKQTSTKAELAREQILIEEQRIQIEQKRLELVRRELTLRKSLGNLASVTN